MHRPAHSAARLLGKRILRGMGAGLRKIERLFLAKSQRL
jgi:hypothetical protein